MFRRTSPTPPLEPEKARRAAYGLALRWLSARELAAASVTSRLADRGFDPVVVDAVVARLTENRFIDDNRAVRACARTLVVVKLRGRQRAQRELEVMGFRSELVRETLDEILGETDELALASRVLASRMHGGQVIRDPATYRRLYGALFRRGFSPSIVRDALKPYWKRGRTPDEPDTAE
ncbi:MAG: RecX family transcriptional regulator [Acidobacteria bacterium]|nr:RecX family transcriptional regulator [Acidobacteriota bacterium]